MIRVICGILLLLLLLTPTARAGESEIVVVGAGTAAINPDGARISIGIGTQGDTAEKAAEECTRIYEGVVGVLRPAGFDRKDIYTTYYRIETRRDEKGRKVVGYSASHSLYISTKELDKVGSLVDAILSSGAATIQEVSYLSSKADSIRRVALASAVRNARQDAEAMAVAAEGNLGSLIELTTHYPDNPTFRADVGQACALSGGMLGYMSITPQPYSVRITVLGRWKMDKSRAETGETE